MIFISQEFLTAPDYDPYHEKLKILNKNFSLRKLNWEP